MSVAAQDYSQSGEQAAILAWAETYGTGRFLDIGAADGETYSTTRALALAGWAGVAVEPAAWAFDRLAMLYAGTSVECVQALATPAETGLADFYYVRNDLISSTDPAHSGKWEEAAPVERVVVACVSLAVLFHRFGGFEFVSIDTEGTSLELLAELQRQGPVWDQVRCLCVEAEDGGERREIERLTRIGWRTLAVTPNNVVLAR